MKPSPVEIAERATKEMRGRASGRTHNMADFFEKCAEYRSLLKDVSIVIPVRPDDGVNIGLARMLSVWYGEGTSWNFMADNMGGFIETARAKIAYDFLYNHTEKYLLMIDNDMEPPVELVLALVRHELPMVSACAMGISLHSGPQLCFTVKDESGEFRFPSLALSGTIPGSGLVECGHVGTGAVLIRRDVFEAFTFEGDDIPFFVPHEVRTRGMRTGELLIGEDLAFCEAVREKGFKVFADMSVHCGHRKTTSMRWPKDAIDESLVAADWVIPAAGQMIHGSEGR